MLSELPTIYWDACVPLSYINGDKERLPDIEGMMQRSGIDFNLITSVFSITEVAFAKAEQDNKALSADAEEKIAKLWQLGTPIEIVEFYELIAIKAKNLMRKALARGWKLKPGDAIQLATADHLKVAEFQTYDEGLDKYREITDTHFKIGRPVASQPVMVLEEEKEASSPTTRPEQSGRGEKV